MLQQTRVETVIPYYSRWMERFPSVVELAEADQDEVLSMWEGLGYYSRARNLHRAARLVRTENNGQLPGTAPELRRLPGIGRYTAGAIASIALGADEPALDGNIRRVLARYFDISEPLGLPETERGLWTLAGECLPQGRAGDFNQALMDLGAMVCTPRSPKCAQCPLEEGCRAKALGVQDQRPVRKTRPRLPHYDVTAAVIERGDSVLIAKRPQDSLLGGMWEFPGGKRKPDEDLVSCLQREIEEELAVSVEVCEPLGVYQHAYTHYRVTLHAFTCGLVDEMEPEPVQVEDVRWVRADELGAYPMGKIDRQIADRLQQEMPSC
jgi:A/G-specific adenine glycosylase